MARLRFSSRPHAEVLQRVFDLPKGGMTPALAESILALDFPEADAARSEELNGRANEGELTDEEEAELEAYGNVNDVLAYWQSRARQIFPPPPEFSRLRRCGGAPTIAGSTPPCHKWRSVEDST